MSKTVLVTGASGFLATWVVRDFLAHGYKVIGTVRSQSKADQMLADLPQYASSLSFRFVPDMGAPGAFDDAVKGVDGVIHTASPYQIERVTDIEKDLMNPIINGATGILKSIKAHNPKIKRVVLTSSFAAVVYPLGKPKGADLDESDWNQMTVEQTKSHGNFLGYVGSKGLAEKAAWAFVENEKPNFELAVVNPPQIFGPNAQPLDSLQNINLSSRDLYDVINGRYEELPAVGVPFWVDARDSATSHRLAYELPQAAGQRYLTVAGTWNYAQIADIIKKNFPELTERVPKKEADDARKLPANGCDGSKAVAQLGMTYRSFEECVVDTVKTLIELEEKEKNRK